MRTRSPHPARRARAVLSLALLVATTTVIVPARPAAAATGDISTVAGNGTKGSAGDGGAATSAQLSTPDDVAVDSAGNLYIADRLNRKVRKVSPDGIITTFAGNGNVGTGGDGGPATSAQISAPTAVAVDAAGNVYIANFDRASSNVRKVDTSGTISTVAGSGPAGYSGDGGPATLAQINLPRGLAVDAAGDLYIADTDNHRIRRVDTSGIITTVAGEGVAGSAGDGGPATSARLDSPHELAFDAAGNLYIADTNNHRIRRVDTSGTITTFSGTGSEGLSGDGGAATSAMLDNPEGVAVDSSGNVYIGDTDNHSIRKVDASGTITTFAGSGIPGFSGDGGPAIAAQLRAPQGLAIDSTGNMFIADTVNDRIRMVAGPPPPPPTVTGTTPASPANNNAPLVKGTAATGTSVRLYTDPACTSPVVGTGSATTFASPGIAVSVADNTTTTFHATATSAFNNTSACSASSITYVEDSTAPAAPAIDAGPGALGSDPTPAWSFSGEPSGTFECQLTRGATVVSASAPCSSPKTYDLSAQPDGIYTFSVVQRDAAGNTSAAATSDYTLDRTAPAAPTITSGPGPTGSDTTPTWAFSGEPGGGFECELSRGATILSDFAACSSPTTYDLSAEADATYRFSVRQIDAAGNTGATTSVDYALDRTAPPAPTITVGPGTTGSDVSPTWEFTGDAGATLQCQFTRGVTVLSPLAACTSPKTYDLSAEADATFTFSVRQVVGGTNPSAFATYDFTLDRGVPAAPVIASGPGATGNNANPGWTFTGEAGASFECQLSSGATVISAFAGCTSPKSYDLSAQPDGAYTFSVRQRDAASNVSAAATSDYTLDRGVPAAPTITSSPGVTGNNANPGWTFTGETGATFECQLSSGATVISAFGSCSSPKSYDLSSQPDGAYTFSVRQRDPAGNTSALATSDYTLDRGVPAAPSITSSPGATGNNAGPTWGFSGEAGASFECQLSSGATVISAFAGCTSPKSYDLSAQPDGAYTFSVRQRDLAGNTSAPATSDYTLDRGLPAAPTITAAPTPDPGNDANPAWSFSGEAGATFECRLTLGASVIFGLAPCSSPRAYDLSAQGDATYTFSVRQTDPAGNTSAFAASDYELDRAVPAAPTMTSEPGATGSDDTPSWSFSGEAGATFECQLSSGATVISAFGSCTSPHSYDLSAQADATYTFSVRQTDPAGNTSAAATTDYALDRGVPAAPTITSTPGATGSDATPTWSFTGEGGATFECQLSSGGTVLSAFASCASPLTYTLSQGDGTYTFSVRQTDKAGNTSAAAASDYVLDQSAPAAPAVNAPAPNPGTDTAPAWTFTGEAGATFQCELTKASTLVSASGPCSSPRSYDLSAEGDGTYTLAVRQTDAAGNTSAVATADYTLDRGVPAAPSITSSPGSPGTDSSPSWSFTGEASASFECQLSQGATVISAYAGCSSPHTADLSAQPDGTYTFSVRQRDAAGNTSAAATSDYALDRAAPAQPTITSTPGATASNANPAWSFTGEAGTTFECQLSQGATVISAFATCTSPHSYDLSAQPDGTYTFSVRQRDAAANTSASATSDYVLDRGVPSAPAVTAPVPNPGNDATPTWFFTGETGSAFECRLSSATGEVAPLAPCASPATYDLSAEPDGTFTLSVRQRDAAGNAGPFAGADYLLDRSTPASPVVDSGPGTGGSDPTPTWTFSGEPGATFSCELRRGNDVISPLTSCTSPISYDLSKHPDGTYTLVLVQTDAAGNRSAPSVADYTLDSSMSPSSPPPPPPPPTTAGQTAPTTPVTPEPTRTSAPASAAGDESLDQGSAIAVGTGLAQAAMVPDPGDAPAAPAGDAQPQPPLPKALVRAPARAPDQTTAMEILAEVAGKTAFPAILVLIVVIFLVIQDRIDRNDPKLAHAPVRSEPLDFIDPPSMSIGR